MKRTAIDALGLWSVYQPDRRIDFSGTWWRREGGAVLIDPMPLAEEQAAIVARDGGARFVLLTNADHWRATSDVKRRFAAAVLAPAAERERLGARADEVDVWFETADDLPEALRDEVEVHWIRGGKSPFEAAFHLRPVRVLVFGDVVRSHAIGRLRLLPDDKLADRAAVVRDVLALRDLNLAAIVLGDGDSLFAGARAAWLEFLRELGSAR